MTVDAKSKWQFYGIICGDHFDAFSRMFSQQFLRRRNRKYFFRSCVKTEKPEKLAILKMRKVKSWANVNINKRATSRMNVPHKRLAHVRSSLLSSRETQTPEIQSMNSSRKKRILIFFFLLRRHQILNLHFTAQFIFRVGHFHLFAPLMLKKIHGNRRSEIGTSGFYAIENIWWGWSENWFDSL